MICRQKWSLYFLPQNCISWRRREVPNPKLVFEQLTSGSQNVRSCLTKLELHHSLVSHLEDFSANVLPTIRARSIEANPDELRLVSLWGFGPQKKLVKSVSCSLSLWKNHEILPKSQFGLTVNQVSATLQGHLHWTGPIFKELWNDGFVTLPVLDWSRCFWLNLSILSLHLCYRFLFFGVYVLLFFLSYGSHNLPACCFLVYPVALALFACWALLVHFLEGHFLSPRSILWKLQIAKVRGGHFLTPPHLRNLKLSKYASWRSYIGKSDTTEAWPTLHCVTRSGPQGNRPSRTHQAKRA